MILRKPYAILIKYFKPIHIIMFISFSYLVFSLRKIYFFFSDYIKTSKFTYIENMTSIYVPWILFVIVIILLALSISILLLMHKKEKPVLFYKIMVAYSVFLLAVFIYFTIFFKSLDDTLYEPLRIVVNRDISLFAYIVNFFFVFFSFIRGFGFDIKKFSFDKDKKELNLEESDSEEYELNVNLEKDDVKRFLNKQKREIVYYIKENKTILTVILVIAIISLSLYTYYTIFVINKVYHEGEWIKIGKLSYRVNSSQISNIDKYGQVIEGDINYLIIDLDIINNERAGYLNSEALRVHINNDYYYPISSACDMFSDLGNCYKNQELKFDVTNNYIVVYKINSLNPEIYLEILKNISDDYKYSKVKLTYKEELVQDKNSSLDEEIEINNTKFKINSYGFLDRATYQYDECINEVCHAYTKVVSPNVGETLLVISGENLQNLTDEFLDSSIGMKYNDKIVFGKDIKLLVRNQSDIYYSVPSYLRRADSLVITTRNIRYILGGSNE